MGKRDRTTDEGTGPKVKTKKKRKDQSDGQPWRPVEMEDDFLTGLDEDGFMGLEELDAPVIFSLSKLQNAKPATGDAASAATAPAATSADRAVTTAVAVDGSDPPGKQKAQKKGKLKKLPKDRAPAVQAAAEVSAPNDASKAVPTGEAGQEKEAALDGSVIVPEAVEELKEGVRRQLERQRAQQERSKQVGTKTAGVPLSDCCPSPPRPPPSSPIPPTQTRMLGMFPPQITLRLYMWACLKPNMVIIRYSSCWASTTSPACSPRHSWFGKSRLKYCGCAFLWCRSWRKPRRRWRLKRRPAAPSSCRRG